MNTTQLEPIEPEATTEQIVAESIPGMLMKKVHTAIKANPAMPVGIFWKQHLGPLLDAVLGFAVEYADDAADDAAEEAGGVPEEIVEGLVEGMVKAKEVVEGSIGLLSETFELLKLLDEQGVPIPDKMPEGLKKKFLEHKPKLEAWTLKYPELIEVEVVEPPPPVAVGTVAS
jgi:hypothetical protein